MLKDRRSRTPCGRYFLCCWTSITPLTRSGPCFSTFSVSMVDVCVFLSYRDWETSELSSLVCFPAGCVQLNICVCVYNKHTHIFIYTHIYYNIYVCVCHGQVQHRRTWINWFSMWKLSMRVGISWTGNIWEFPSSPQWVCGCFFLFWHCFSSNWCYIIHSYWWLICFWYVLNCIFVAWNIFRNGEVLVCCMLLQCFSINTNEISWHAEPFPIPQHILWNAIESTWYWSTGDNSEPCEIQFISSDQ